MLSRLFHQYVQIALLRLAPHELPGQPVALYVAVGAAFATSMAGLLFAYDFDEALYRSVLSLLVPGIFLYLLLRARGLQNRYAQSFGALCGTAAVVYLLALPFMPYFFRAMESDQSSAFVIALILLLDIWALLISAHILKHALDIEFVTGISLSFLLMLVTILAIESLVPSEPAADIGSELGQHSSGSVQLIALANPPATRSGKIIPSSKII